MTKELTEPQRLWVNALRSGEYQQVKSTLTDGKDYCCLGVACDLYVKAGFTDIKYTKERDAFVTADDGEERIFFEDLPLTVQKWLGLDSSLGEYNFPSEEDGICSTNLAEENDGGRSFKSIADIIESRPEGLFV